MAKARASKVVFLGPSSSGKTSLIHRFVKGSFYDQQPTIGTAFYTREVDTGSDVVSLHIWDTAGMERYKSLVPRYSKGASVAVIVFDLTDPGSYAAGKKVLAETPNLCDPDTIPFFVGNKVDSPSAIDIEDAREFAEQNRAVFIETSAKSGENVNELFQQIAYRFMSCAHVPSQLGGPIEVEAVPLPQKECCK
jgi:small GTP-binding protein